MLNSEYKIRPSFIKENLNKEISLYTNHHLKLYHFRENNFLIGKSKTHLPKEELYFLASIFIKEDVIFHQLCICEIFVFLQMISHGVK